MAQLNYLKRNNDNKNLQHKVNGQNKGIDNRRQVVQSAADWGKRERRLQ